MLFFRATSIIFRWSLTLDGSSEKFPAPRTREIGFREAVIVAELVIEENADLNITGGIQREFIYWDHCTIALLSFKPWLTNS